MPFIHVHLAKGVFDDDQKEELQRRFTDVITDIEGHEQFRQLVTVVIAEEDLQHWCMGGEQLTPDKVRSLLTSS